MDLLKLKNTYKENEIKMITMGILLFMVILLFPAHYVKISHLNTEGAYFCLSFATLLCFLLLLFISLITLINKAESILIAKINRLKVAKPGIRPTETASSPLLKFTTIALMMIIIAYVLLPLLSLWWDFKSAHFFAANGDKVKEFFLLVSNFFNNTSVLLLSEIISITVFYKIYKSTFKTKKE